MKICNEITSDKQIINIMNYLYFCFQQCDHYMRVSCETCFNQIYDPAGNFMFKVNDRNTRTRVNFEHISHLVPVFLLLTLSR